MSIDRRIKTIVWNLALPISIVLSVPASMNAYRNHNVDYTIEEKRVLKKWMEFLPTLKWK